MIKKRNNLVVTYCVLLNIDYWYRIGFHSIGLLKRPFLEILTCRKYFVSHWELPQWSINFNVGCFLNLDNRDFIEDETRVFGDESKEKLTGWENLGLASIHLYGSRVWQSLPPPEQRRHSRNKKSNHRCNQSVKLFLQCKNRWPTEFFSYLKTTSVLWTFCVTSALS